MNKKIFVICLALIVGLAILSPRLTQAQSLSSLSSRVSRLEAENFQMRSQISRLEAQLARISGQPSPQIPRSPTPAPSVPLRENQQGLTSEQMFDNLATLVIELKERIQILEKQPCRCNSNE